MEKQDRAQPTPEAPLEQREREPFRDLVLFTTTFYGTDSVSRVRQPLCEKLLHNAAELGIKCVVVDGGSNQEFLERLRSMGNVELHVDPKLGMGESRREAIEIAMTYPAPYLFWTEPEKDGLITKESLTAMIKGLRENTTDIVVPRRQSKESAPKFQAWIESRANERVMNQMPEDQEEQEALDLWFGPKMFNREGARFFAEYRGTLDKWDATIKPVIEAAKAGKRISAAEVDYRYDPSQSESEKDDRVMKMKRIDQYRQILGELGDQFWNREEKQRTLRRKKP